jgi:hypothetical protein
MAICICADKSNERKSALAVRPGRAVMPLRTLPLFYLEVDYEKFIPAR